MTRNQEADNLTAEETDELLYKILFVYIELSRKENIIEKIRREDFLKLAWKYYCKQSGKNDPYPASFKNQFKNVSIYTRPSGMFIKLFDFLAFHFVAIKLNIKNQDIKQISKADFFNVLHNLSYYDIRHSAVMLNLLEPKHVLLTSDDNSPALLSDNKVDEKKAFFKKIKLLSYQEKVKIERDKAEIIYAVSHDLKWAHQLLIQLCEDLPTFIGKRKQIEFKFFLSSREGDSYYSEIESLFNELEVKEKLNCAITIELRKLIDISIGGAKIYHRMSLDNVFPLNRDIVYMKGKNIYNGQDEISVLSMTSGLPEDIFEVKIKELRKKKTTKQNVPDSHYYEVLDRASQSKFLAWFKKIDRYFILSSEDKILFRYPVIEKHLPIRDENDMEKKI